MPAGTHIRRATGRSRRKSGLLEEDASWQGHRKVAGLNYLSIRATKLSGMPMKTVQIMFWVVPLFLGLHAELCYSQILSPVGTAEGCHVRTTKVQDKYRWNGACVNGFASGSGTLIRLKNGQLYSEEEGTMVDGAFEGQSTTNFAGGNRYSGNVIHGFMDRGTFTFSDGRTVAIVNGRPVDSTAEASDANICIALDDIGNHTFKLKNSCGYPINVLYTFSKSKPFSGGYITLRPNEETFETSDADETIDGWACKFPGVPQSLKGECM